MTDAAILSNSPSLEERQAGFIEWVNTVRDPARQSSEGVRRIEDARRRAVAEYEVAPLPDGRFAIHFSLSFRCADYEGRSVPWTPCPTREKCLALFLDHARTFFHRGGDSQAAVDLKHSVRREMHELLRGDGLFGFLEPTPVRETELHTDLAGPDASDHLGSHGATSTE